MIDHTYFLNALWSITKDAVLCFDEKGTIQCANPRARDTFAWADNINDFGTVDDLHLEHEDGRPFSWQSRFSEKNYDPSDEVLTGCSSSGSLLRLEAATSRVMVAEKSYLFCRLTNVIRPVEQEQAHAVLEEKLHNFFYLCPSAVCVTEVSDGRIHQVNKSLIELSGYTEKELVGSTTLELGFWTQQEDRDRLVQQLIKHREGQVDAILRTKSGRLIEGEVHSRMILTEGAKRFITVFRDNSQSKAAERAQLLINQATNDAIYDWNLQNGKVWWNDMVTMFGYRSEEIDDTITWWHERIHPEDRQRVVDRINTFISKRLEKWFDKYRFKRKDNSYAYVYDKGYFEFNSDGTPVQMVGGMVDITERVLAEESILIKNRQIAEYAFFNSHKLRGPLARMMGLVELIDFQEAHREENKTLLNHLKVIAEELDELIKDVSKVLY
ncbi:MAG: PAS domain S-box protein [Tunicatimonas sp.]